ncbi:unnamed protein product [Sympodiomycopsis kandeliae]
MATQDDFLFNLNDFTAGVTPSSRAHDKSNSNNNDNNNTSSILAGLNAFTPEDGDMESNASANFADQLALWTNANFSFDGPTGHALLLDDEKDEEAKREERERHDREEAARGGGTSAASAHQSRRGESSRDGAAVNAMAAAVAASRDHSTQGTPVTESAPRAQGKVDNSQQSRYFPSSSSGNDARRSDHAAFNNSNINDRRRAENDSVRSTSEDFNPFNFLNGNVAQEQQKQSQQSQQQGGQFGHDGQFQPIINGNNNVNMSPELIQALAFQQILSSGPSGQSTANMFGVPGFFSGAAAPSLANGTLPATNGSFIPPAFANGQGGLSMPQGWGFVGANGSQHNIASSSPSGANSDNADDKVNSEDGDSNGSSKRRRQLSKKNGEESAAARRKREEQEEIAQALRDEMPPLELIDTGNPEADAEANRVAIEEDKRRRNTAASARFRIKKKQREQALEQAAKELEQRVRDLEDENSRLNTENGWLKSLITIRPSGSGPTFTPLGPHQMSALGPFTGTGMQPQRDTGLQPRGVGTPNGAGAPSLQQQQQQQQQGAVAGGKRSRED